MGSADRKKIAKKDLTLKTECTMGQTCQGSSIPIQGKGGDGTLKGEGGIIEDHVMCADLFP
jgi:hypothetical protein